MTTGSHTSAADSNPAQSRWVHRRPMRVHVQDHPGRSGPAIVLLHGFPDDHHLYDRLVPRLAPERRVVTFDFLGWGSSDKPRGYRHTAADQVEDVDAVVTQLALDEVVLVAHDASGPPAIEWALLHPERVAALVLLNTYYAFTPALRRPPAIALYSTPALRVVGRFVARRSPTFDRWLYCWQVGRFMSDAETRDAELPGLYHRFQAAREAFWQLNEDLLSTVIRNRRRRPALRRFTRPVRIVFGADDRYLNPGVARWFHRQFPTSDLHLVPGARHYVQVDRPEAVAALIRTAHQPRPT
jgi:haloalkane dehalogenase